MPIIPTQLKLKPLAVILAIVSWSLMLLGELWEQYHFLDISILTTLPLFFKGLLINLFIIGIYVYLEKTLPLEELDFNALLWQVFISTLLATILSGLDNILLILIGQSKEKWHILVETIFFQIEFGLFILILTSTFCVWKRMVLFEKNHHIETLWTAFESLLLVLMLSHFFKLDINNWLYQILLILMILWILTLTTNVRWMLQLNFNQKLRAILQMIVMLFCIAYLFFSLTAYYSNELLLIDEIYRSLFSSVVIAFVLIYGFISILFLAFNLPTSQAIEKRLQDFSLMQILSESIIEGKTEKEVLEIFFNSAVSALQVDAAWLELSEGRVYFKKDIEIEEIKLTSQLIEKHTNKLQDIQRLTFSRFLGKNKNYIYNSYLTMPFGADIGFQGKLILLKRLHYGFDKVMERTVQSLASQAEMAIHNLRLLSQALEHSRVKSELEIARKVQKQLLPTVQSLSKSLNIKVEVFSESATEVGGDYYDFYQPSNEELVLIVADVAGHGISSAFNMAQMKGIFQTIVRQHLYVEKFMAQANAALVGCLEKNSFITASYFHIHTTLKTITFSRAGHCPALYFDAQNREVRYLESAGMGLGIIRNASYEKYVAKEAFTYQYGDILLLYTDGLVESKGENSQETYSFERLKAFFEQYCLQKSSQTFAELVLTDLQLFTNSNSIKDDFTLVLIRL
jgi:serine phosphatase RsbU (regulator of sigma subunit)